MENPRLKLLFSKEEVQQKIIELSRKISSDYKGKHPVTIGVLKGSFVFSGSHFSRVSVRDCAQQAAIRKRSHIPCGHPEMVVLDSRCSQCADGYSGARQECKPAIGHGSRTAAEKCPQPSSVFRTVVQSEFRISA